ncbi:MAG: universal stress protein [Nitrososphaeraceae archaeon]
MTVDKEYELSSNNEKANLKPTKESDLTHQAFPISKETLPPLSKILSTDDGKDESNKALNYAASLSRYTGAELLILRIIEHIDKIEDVSVQASSEDNMSNKDTKLEVKGQIIDEMEIKLKSCKEAGCQNKISYKFRVGDAIEEIVKEVKEGNYDLIVLRSTHIDSWMKSLLSDARRIISNINIPVLIVQ